MQTVVWNTCRSLECNSLTDVYIFVDYTIAISGLPYIVGRATLRAAVCNAAGETVTYSYTLSYDEVQLIAPPLDPCAIECVLCRDCLIKYIDALNVPSLPYILQLLTPYFRYPLIGDTAHRPVLDATALNIGVLYMDTDLDANGLPIWWNGVAWVNYAGALV